MENLICNAFTFLEFNGTEEEYLSDSLIKQDPIPYQQKRINWRCVVEDYMKVSEFMDDNAIQQAHHLIMSEL